MGRAITFTSSDHKTGCGLLARQTAKELAGALPGSRVMLLTTRSGPLEKEERSESLERLLPYIDTGRWEMEEIRERSAAGAGLHIIRGFSSPGLALHCDPDKASAFIRALRASFDMVVLDAGADIFEPFPLACLLSADAVCQVLTESAACLDRYLWLRPLHEKLGIVTDLFVLNRRSASSVRTKKEICEMSGIEDSKFITVKELAISGILAAETEDFALIKDSGFMKDIRRLAQALREASERRR